MLIVKTPDGSVEYPDAQEWSVTPGDERLILLNSDQTGPEQPSNPKALAEYARSAWNSVERSPEPAQPE